MRTHLNVAAKLELQTQEKMYESRLHHLENVLEGKHMINMHCQKRLLISVSIIIMSNLLYFPQK